MTGPRLETEENQNQNQEPQNQNNQNQQQLETSETQTQNTPPSNTDVIPRSEYEQTLQNTHSLYRQALQEAETKRLELERQIASQRQEFSPAPIPEDQLSPAQLIERAVAAQVSPLKNQFDQFMASQQQNTYQSIKDRFRNMPQFTPFFTMLEPHLDTEMQGKQISVENVQNALATVIGRIQMQAAMNPQNNQQQQVNPNQNTQQMPNNQAPQNQNQNRNQNLPPHLRPSAPPLPNRNGNQNLTPNGNPIRELNQFEARIARENKLTHEQYIDWISESPTNVVHSQIGITPKP